MLRNRMENPGADKKVDDSGKDKRNQRQKVVPDFEKLVHLTFLVKGQAARKAQEQGGS